MADSSLIQEYLDNPHSAERIKILQKIRESEAWIPISLCSDLLKIKLHHEEHIAILRASSTKQRIVFEDYLTSQLANWDQNVAAAALWEWSLRTDCIMWHRTLPLSTSAHSTQRIRYTLADLAWYGGGFPLIQRLVHTEGLEDMSVAYHALMCFRALQFGVKCDRLLALARETVENTHALPEKTLPYYLAYLFRFDPDWIMKQKLQQGMHGIWSQFLRTQQDEKLVEKDLKTFLSFAGKDLKKSDVKALLRCWPALWDRKHVRGEHLSLAFRLIAGGKAGELAEQNWEFFAGVSQEAVTEALQSCEDTRSFVLTLNTCGSFLDYDAQTQQVSKLRDELQKAEDPSAVVATLLPRYSALLNASGTASVFSKIFQERQQTIAAFRSDKVKEIESLGLWEKEFTPDEASRQNFFALAYHGRRIEEPRGQDLWSALSRAWMKPTADKIDAIAQLSRQAPHLFQICFIDTLGRFRGHDVAALKLLDFIRSKEESVLRAIIYALQGISTARSTQELVAFLTRPNISHGLQLEIAQLLKDLDVSDLQAELRSALNDLNYRQTGDNLMIELRDALASLLVVKDAIKGENEIKNNPSAPTTMDLDRMLEQRISRYNQLSSEVKRALRTAQFFHLQVEQVGAQLGTIDLSPAIDMQYKALELCFREKFEEVCGEIIRQGTLQRKLDVIGYARPIPQAMDEFEQYIENLPIIHTIPFFSRFKLRKMLRAICQYRPGKRFTLDGLKAFALFFICFSRRECRYGLGGIFPIPNMNTDQLFMYCKELHIFQDFRNRAAHEGFHPDASNNLDSIWKSTERILDGMFLIADGLEDMHKPTHYLKSS